MRWFATATAEFLIAHLWQVAGFFTSTGDDRQETVAFAIHLGYTPGGNASSWR